MDRFLQESIEIDDRVLNLLGKVAELKKAIAAIRKSDCGAWLKDCSSIAGFNCSQGREKRIELSKLLDELYKTAKERMGW